MPHGTGLEWVGPGSADALSAMAREIIFEFYTFVDREALEKFYLDNQSPDAIRRQFAEGYRYAYITEGHERIGYASYLVKGRFMLINKLYLHAESRGHGAGSEVLDTLIGIARDEGVDTITLRVNAKNDGAIRLYERKGFHVMCTEDVYNNKIYEMEYSFRRR